MGLRYRKSFKIAPGVRVNLSKKGVGMSVGTKGARYSVSSTGRRTTTIGIPGTGLSYSKSRGGGKKSANKTAVSVRTGPGFFWWVFIGWWWWPIRLICYDLPKFIIKKTKQLIASAKAAKETEKPEA